MENKQEGRDGIIKQYTCQKCGKAGYRRGIFDVLCGGCFIEMIDRGARQKELEAEQNEKILTSERAKSLAGGEVVIPEGYVEIGDRAFDWHYDAKWCDVKSISIPASVVDIGYRVLSCMAREFRVAEGSQYFSVDSNGVLFTERIEDGQNAPLPMLIKYPQGRESETYTVPEGVRIISEEAFMKSQLKEVVFPASLWYIEAAAFSNCYKLEEIRLPSGIQFIYDTAFRSCGGLRNISISEEAPHYTCEDGILFNKDKTVLLKYPAQKPQDSYKIPDNVLVIGVNAFGGCRNLKNIEIPDSVEIISNGAFAGCTFEGINLPKNLAKIGYHAFEGCDSLKELVVPASVTHLDETVCACCGTEVVREA